MSVPRQPPHTYVRMYVRMYVCTPSPQWSICNECTVPIQQTNTQILYIRTFVWSTCDPIASITILNIPECIQCVCVSASVLPHFPSPSAIPYSLPTYLRGEKMTNSLSQQRRLGQSLDSLDKLEDGSQTVLGETDTWVSDCPWGLSV